MGSENGPLSKPVHKVTLTGFQMMTTEVTNIQFEAYLKKIRPAYSNGDNMPVMGVTRAEIDGFVKWLSKKDNRKYSIPTEAQWEYAARGGVEGSDYPWGNRFDTGRAHVGGTIEIGNVSAKDVKSFPPNQYGLYDMCGNASEIVYDSYADYTAESLTNPKADAPTGDDDGVVRGLGINDYFPQVWFRSPYDPKSSDDPYGFRLVINE